MTKAKTIRTILAETRQKRWRKAMLLTLAFVVILGFQMFNLLPDYSTTLATLIFFACIGILVKLPIRCPKCQSDLRTLVINHPSQTQFLSPTTLAKFSFCPGCATSLDEELT